MLSRFCRTTLEDLEPGVVRSSICKLELWDTDMDSISRRHLLAAAAAGGLLTTGAFANAQTAGNAIPQPQRPGHGGTDHGPRNLMRDQQNPDLLVPPSTDHGTLPNLRFSFSDAHTRLEPGGWTRQVTQRELGVAKSMAGVNMRLNAGGVRELHWHRASEWAYMLYGKARVTAVDSEGRYFVDDVGVGDLWFFPGGTPHSIQGLGPDGCEFLLVFDDGDFDEDNTFLLNDWFKHVPTDVLGKNFGVPASLFGHTPDESERYIFPAPLPGPLGSDSIPGAKAAETSYTWRMMEQVPIKTRSGTVRITDSRLFRSAPRRPRRWSKSSRADCASCTGTPMETSGSTSSRDRHEWVFLPARGRRAHSICRPAMCGYVPVAMGHYLENTGSTTFRFLETFKSDRFVDFLSIHGWQLHHRNWCRRIWSSIRR